MEDLNPLEHALDQDLKLTNHPPSPWIMETHPDVLDVAIIGAGMVGLTAAFALNLQGIFNVKVYDELPAYQEGPWINYARMRTLRSPKNIMGPALGIPHLTFQAWFKAQFGEQAWETLYKIPTNQWMDYLNWYRDVLHIPIENECLLTLIEPATEGLHLHFQRSDQQTVIKARKVVLATGRPGFGSAAIPKFMQNISKEYYKHTNEWIDFEALQGKQVGIIGVGASAFDAAAVALEHGAKNVELLTRRSHIPNINKMASLNYPGFTHGYFQLSDETRWKFMSHAFESGSLPPFEALDRIASYSNVTVRKNVQIDQVQVKDY